MNPAPFNPSYTSRATRSDSLEAWSHGIERLGAPDELLKELRVPKATRFARLEALGLVRQPMLSTTVPAFLSAPRSLLAKVPGRSLIVFLDVIRDTTPIGSISSAKLARDQVVDWTKRAVEPFSTESILLTIFQAYRILVNGNILVTRDGGFCGEFSAAGRSPSQQRTRLDCRVERDRYLRVFRYLSGSPSLRHAVCELIDALPGEYEGRERDYLPGYYEAALGESEDDGRTVPIFYDYRDHPFFLGPTRT